MFAIKQALSGRLVLDTWLSAKVALLVSPDLRGGALTSRRS
jgi:hypothetical protein